MKLLPISTMPLIMAPPVTGGFSIGTAAQGKQTTVQPDWTTGLTGNNKVATDAAPGGSDATGAVSRGKDASTAADMSTSATEEGGKL